MKVNITVDDYKPTITELANEIWNLSSKDQLELLCMLANIDDNYKICMQLQNMMDDKHEDSDIYKDIDRFIGLLNEYLNDFR